MTSIEKIYSEFKKFENPLILKDRGITFNRFIFKENIILVIDYLRKNELGAELLSIKMTDKNIKNLVDAKEKLENFSNLLCDRINFLTENFRLIEIDRQNNKAQIRSYPPFIRQNEKLFFEIIINANEPSIYLCRKVVESDKKITKPAAFVLNDEVFQRLLQNLNPT